MSVYNQRYAYAYLVDRGFPPNAAAGIVGNLIQESGVDPYSNQQGGPGRGIMQWSEGERWQSLLAFAQQQGRNPMHLETQLDFMLHEMKAYGVYGRMQSMNNLHAATTLFMNVMESPDPKYANLDGRIQFAETIRAKDPNMATGAGGGNAKQQDNGGGGGGGNNNGGNNNGTPDMTKGEYGFDVHFLDAHPEIKKLVDQADKENWTLTRFQAEIKETSWYRHLTDAQQRWSVLQSEKPAQSKQEIDDQAMIIRRLAGNMGVELNANQIDDLAKRAARNQLDTATLTTLIGRQFTVDKGKGSESGQASVSIDQLRTMAEDYGIHLDNATLQRWTQQIVMGQQTVEGLTDKIREQAKNMLPHLAGQLDRYTTRDLLEPYLNAASTELGISTNDMRTSDQKWLGAIARKDGPLSMDDWMTMLHTDKKYDYNGTLKATGEASTFVTQLGQKMGVLA